MRQPTRLQIIGTVALIQAAALPISVLAQWQGPAFRPKGAGWQVGLCSSGLAPPVWDTNLAAMVAPAAQRGCHMSFAFNICFGGGMIDNLMAIVPADIVATSAQRWSRPAYYPSGNQANRRIPALTGAAVANDHFVDWGDTFSNGIGPANAEANANDAWQHDPKGTNGGGGAAVAGTADQGPAEIVAVPQTAQYNLTHAGMAGWAHTTVPAARRFAILWSGQPDNVVDPFQISQVWTTLTANLGYNAANIYVLYGAGGAAQAAQLPAGVLNLRRATQGNLQALFNFGGALNTLGAGDQLFFFANDHGDIRNIGGGGPAAMPPGRWVQSARTTSTPFDVENFTGTYSSFFGSDYVCYTNCDGSTTAPVLNVGDFTCYLQKFAAGDEYANCDESTSPPILNVGDFTCFLQRFAAGCN